MKIYFLLLLIAMIAISLKECVARYLLVKIGNAKDRKERTVASKSSDDYSQLARCSSTYENIEYESETIDRTLDNLDGLRKDLIKYCELYGVFVFYSEKEFQGAMKYGQPGMKKDLDSLEPEENILSKVESVRIVGDLDYWKASTLTFFSETEFRGKRFLTFHRYNRGEEFDFKPRSVIVTGTDDWTVFSNNDEECRVIKFDYADGYPGFFRDLPDIGIEWTIKRAVVGCLCKDDPYVYCNIDEK